MSGLNINDFLKCGAFLQIGADLFKVLIGPFERHESVISGHLKHQTLLFKPNFWDFLSPPSELTQKPVYSGATAHNFDREEFIHFLSSAAAKKPDIQWKNPNEMQFRTQFDWSQKNIAEKKLLKTVPIICQQGHAVFSVENLLWCAQNLIQNKNFGWSYGFFENNEGVIGHTPEILAQWTRADRQLHTVALAGTYAKNESAFEKILKDEKILNEHQIVIDDIVEKLNSLDIKSRSIQGPTDILELKYLLHLMTEFQIEIGSIEEVFEIINILHPTSAMGLYPNDRTKFSEFFGFSLQQERKSFAAPFAIFEEEAVYCVATIRNMFFNKEQIKIYSGCGVTIDSQYEVELAELAVKRESVKKMLGLPLD